MGYAIKIFNRCYNSIEVLPVYNWMKINDTGDYTFLLKEKYKCSKFELLALAARWKKIYDQYIFTFGFNDNFLDVLEIQKKIALLQIEWAETDDGILETFIDIEKVKLEKKNSQLQKGDFYQLKMYLEKSLGFKINPKECTVIEFYNYIKQLDKK